MKRRSLLLLLCIGLACLLSGCFRSVDELYALPKLPEEYQDLQAKIEEVTATGAEYSAPLRGENNQPVQFQDLDGDGLLEAVAFFRTAASNTDEKPLKIYIFHLTGEGYELSAVVEGEGSAIHSISYEDVAGGAEKELVVSWLSGGSALSVSVHSLGRKEAVELMRSAYTSAKLLDLDMDNRKELALVRMDAIEGESRVELWKSDGEEMVLCSSAMLSQGVTGIDTSGVQVGALRGETSIPALFVTSYQGEGILTDIFAWRDGALENITLEESGSAGGVSYATRRAKADAKITDINEDGVLEVPIPVNMASEDTSATADVLSNWYQYDLEGKGWPVFTTYHSFEDSWYFILSDDWADRVNVHQYSSVTGEKATIFALHREDGSDETFLTVYKLTGPNRHMRSRLGERFVLASDDTTIYCAELSGTWDSGLDMEGVRAHFRQIRTDWSTGI